MGENVNTDNLKARTKQFALDIIRFVQDSPDNKVTRVLGYQLLKSGTSVGANYRSACRSRSRADFISKMGIVEEECDETAYWLELFLETGYGDSLQIKKLCDESDEITAIVVASIKTARKNKFSDKG